MAKKLPNIHPGVLFEEFLKPLDISQNKLARTMGVPPRRINEIVHGKRVVTADTAIRLSPVRWAHLSSSGWGCKLITIWKKRTRRHRAS